MLVFQYKYLQILNKNPDTLNKLTNNAQNTLILKYFFSKNISEYIMLCCFSSEARLF